MFADAILRRGVLALLGAGMIVSAAPARAGSSLTNYGDVAQYAIPMLAATVSAVKADGDGLWQLGATSVATMGTTYALKYGIDRERPKGRGGQSFPSGHTAFAFMGASYLHYRYGWGYGLPAYVAASVVGYSRVDADKHYWSDVIGAALIANISAYILTDTQNNRVVVIPFANRGKRNLGIVAKLRF